ncbi:NADPH-dependent FMN reductase [Fredinandcohnia sp. 179-A 10B2 NHS]|uniref:NADPH-dependent FMN reductase n=1 Tax=Fredinandcohnia sp. 179-A 10B2 NHS TaxID=3235176 RepID=UPI0039A2A73B
MKIVGICGSLRSNSINKALLVEASKFLPNDSELVIADISNLPLFDSDLEGDLPVSVKELVAIVSDADGYLISCPEYNSSITGALKNALDWLSRPVTGTPLVNKPVAIMGATPGVLATIRAQMHLREILFALNMDLVRRPELLIGQALQKFNEHGHLTDERALSIMEELVQQLMKKVNFSLTKV